MIKKEFNSSAARLPIPTFEDWWNAYYKTFIHHKEIWFFKKIRGANSLKNQMEMAFNHKIEHFITPEDEE